MFDDDDEEEDMGTELQEALQRYLNGEGGFFSSDHYDFIIEHYMTIGEYQEVKVCLSQAMDLYPSNELFNLRKAQLLSSTGELNAALKVLEDMDATGIELDFLATKAVIFSQLKDHKNAIKLYKQAIDLALYDERDELYLDLAGEYQNIGDVTSAIAVLKKSLELNPKNEIAIYELAFCLEQLGQFEESIKAYDDFIDNNPYSFTAWYNLGNAYTKMEQYDNAINAYDYCLVINDDFTPARFNLGNTYLAAEKFKEAIECFSECIEREGEDALLLCYLGECWENLLEYDQAIAYYNRSIKMAPELAEPWIGKGIVFDLMEKTLEGISLIRHGISLEPENASYWHVLAGAAEKIDDLELAEHAYSQAYSFFPGSDEVYCDFVSFKVDQNIDDAIEFVHSIPVFQKCGAWYLSTLFVQWMKNRADSVLTDYKNLINTSPAYAKELFLFFPDLEDDPDFTQFLTKNE